MLLVVQMQWCWCSGGGAEKLVKRLRCRCVGGGRGGDEVVQKWCSREGVAEVVQRMCSSAMHQVLVKR